MTKKTDQPQSTESIENINSSKTDVSTEAINKDLVIATNDFENLTEDYKMTVGKNTLNPEDIHYVVGVGASAGGLEALQHMVANLPTNTGMSFVIAQHLSPSYKSMMVDLLEKDSTIPVVPAKHQASLQPDTIYVCPPNYNIEINHNDQIILTAASQERQSPRPSVDLLFESIAVAKKENAIGIVLSGTGSDGARGIRAIKGEGGFGIAQDPNAAKYNGMPNSAINSGNIDLILNAQEIGLELKNILKFPRAHNYSFEETAISRDNYNRIMGLVKKHFNVDFTLYKETTILRRIERRMTTLKIPKIEDYLSYSMDNAKEIELLFNDFLIGVTAFFRDNRAFESLHTHLQHYFVNKSSKVFRAWIPGCSTGEEAYSIAILLNEVIGPAIDEYKIQIFATDIDKNAIEFARNGVYPESALQNMPDLYKRKYFTLHNDHYEVIKPIKANLIFSVHNLINDPPFLRLDLLSCRNLLIYFNLELQRQLIPIFHYALNPKGLLFLGQSESIGVFHEQFRSASRSGKVYEAVFLGKKHAPLRNVSYQDIEDYIDPVQAKDDDMKVGRATKPSFEITLQDLITEKLNQEFFKYVIVLNENLDIIFNKGQNPLLVRPDGQPSNNIYKNLHPTLTIDLRSAMHSLELQDVESIKTPYQRLEIGNNSFYARINLLRIEERPRLGALFLLLCQIDEEMDVPRSMDSNAGEERFSKEQERQLIKAKEQLQSVIEELETSNEEMQSMNEELQSSNEELQSSNEELETTNEELQSTNEELQTAYAELRVAYEDKEAQQSKLEQLTCDLAQSNQRLREAEFLGKIGAFNWDINSRKLNWTTGASHLFEIDDENFSPSYEAFIGLAHSEDRAKLEKYIHELLEGKSLKPLVYRVQKSSSKNTIWIEFDAVVSFNDLKQANKLIGTLKDVSQIVAHQQQLSEKESLIEEVFDIPAAQSVFDFSSEKFTHLNDRFIQLFNVAESQIEQGFNSDEFIDQISKESRDSFIAYLSKVQKLKLTQTMTIRFKLKPKNSDTDSLEVRATVSPLEMLENNRVKSCIVTIITKPI